MSRILPPSRSFVVSTLSAALGVKWVFSLASNENVLGVLTQSALAYTLPLVVLFTVMPALLKTKQSKSTKTQLQQLKHNPQIFEALLSKQKSITESPEGLGILLGNANPTYKILKVCNPYCGPCAKAHIPMEELLENNPNIQIQIIFSPSSSDYKSQPVRHLLAIDQTKGAEQVIKTALDDWYLPEERDFGKFAAKYPLNGELKMQDAKIDAMNEWCKKNDIAFTPTFFINGYQMPEMYSVSDLKYFLSV